MHLQLGDVQSGHSVILFSKYPLHLYLTTHNAMCSFHLPWSPFSPFTPSPTPTLPTFFSLCLIMDFVMFEDVFAAGVY